MNCTYNTGNKLCDFLGWFLNGNVWVHKDADGEDWGKRVWVHAVRVREELKGIEVHVSERSERAVSIYIYIDPKSHEKLRGKHSGDNGILMSWEGLLRFLAKGITIVDGGKRRKASVSDFGRTPMLELVHLADDAIHIMPVDDGTYSVRLEQWMIDVMGEEGMIDVYW